MSTRAFSLTFQAKVRDRDPYIKISIKIVSKIDILSIKLLEMRGFEIIKGNVNEFIVSVGLFCFGCGIGISLIFFISKCIAFSKINAVSRSMVGFAILASVFYGLSSLFDGLYWMYYINLFNNELLGNLCDYGQILCWHIGQLIVYCYLLNRLYKGFQGTVYLLTSRTLVLLFTLLVFYLFACLLIMGLAVRYIIWCYINSSTSVDDLPLDSKFEYAYRAVTLGIDLILSVSLLGIFVNKLCKVSKKFKRNDAKR